MVLGRDYMKQLKSNISKQSGRIGYFVLWLLGAPVGVLLLLWVVLGNNIFGAG